MCNGFSTRGLRCSSCALARDIVSIDGSLCSLLVLVLTIPTMHGEVSDQVQEPQDFKINCKSFWIKTFSTKNIIVMKHHTLSFTNDIAEML